MSDATKETPLRIVPIDGQPVEPVFWIAPNGDRYEVIHADCYKAQDGSTHTVYALFRKYTLGAK